MQKEVEFLREEIKLLREENKLLEKRVEELEKMWEEHIKICPLFHKPKPLFIKEETRVYHHKSGQKEGHEGISREIPEKIDEVKKIDLKKCPDCTGKLSRIQEKRERVITNIEIKTTNIKYIISRRYCKQCKKIVEPEIKDALPNSRFSLKIMLLILMLKLDCRIPSNKITSILSSVFGIKISDGEIYNVLAQLSKAYGNYYQELVKKIKHALIKNIDETSWRVNGKNNWLWLFINKEVALYVVNRKRSSKVPVKILGNQEGKTAITDRHSAYNQLVKETGIAQQICWAHLIRNSKDLAEHYKEAKYIHKRLKYIYRKARARERKEKLLYWIELIASRSYKSSEVFKFVKSICRNHKEDLFRFVDNPEIDSTNNRAEGGLRPAVVIRKISGGSRSERGAENAMRLLSVLQTAKLQTNNYMNFMQDLLQKGK